MDYDDLLARCESEIESHLLGALYPNLGPDAQKEIEAQHIIDYYDMPLTLPDFAFPDLQIAIRRQAIRRQARGREDQPQRMRMPRGKLPLSGAFAAGLVAVVVLMILIESFFPALFYHLTAGF